MKCYYQSTDTGGSSDLPSDRRDLWWLRPWTLCRGLYIFVWPVSVQVSLLHTYKSDSVKNRLREKKLLNLSGKIQATRLNQECFTSYLIKRKNRTVFFILRKGYTYTSLQHSLNPVDFNHFTNMENPSVC